MDKREENSDTNSKKTLTKLKKSKRNGEAHDAGRFQKREETHTEKRNHSEARLPLLTPNALERTPEEKEKGKGWLTKCITRGWPAGNTAPS